MMSVSVKDARAHLSTLIKKTHQSGKIIITSRGKNVACLDGFSESRPPIPSMKEFRKSIKTNKKSLSEAVSLNRESEKF
jgi:prevent-host-death family protein